jgi:DNA polymerase-3 subunit delta'
MAALVAWQKVLLRTARHDEHPWNAALLIESLVTQATGAWGQTAAVPGKASVHSAR